MVRENFDDVRAEVFARVVQKLRGVNGERVVQLDDYVAAITRNCIHDCLRAHRPQRARLKARLRFILGNDRRLASWSAGGTTLCGLAPWRGSAARAEGALSRANVPPAVLDAAHPASALAALFEFTGVPLELETLVALLMNLWNIVEETAVDIESVSVEDARPTQLASLETRAFLDALWSEVSALSPPQRAALLLNLRDHEGGNALTLFILLGIADFDRIAATIGIAADELAGLWCGLPLDDAAIAARLGLTRQQVINLRKSARERLRRRLGK